MVPQEKEIKDKGGEKRNKKQAKISKKERRRISRERRHGEKPPSLLLTSRQKQKKKEKEETEKESPSLTSRVPDSELGYLAALSVDVVGPVKQHHGSLHEPHATGEVQRGVAVAVTH